MVFLSWQQKSNQDRKLSLLLWELFCCLDLTCLLTCHLHSFICVLEYWVLSQKLLFHWVWLLQTQNRSKCWKCMTVECSSLNGHLYYPFQGSRNNMRGLRARSGDTHTILLLRVYIAIVYLNSQQSWLSAQDPPRWSSQHSIIGSRGAC